MGLKNEKLDVLVITHNEESYVKMQCQLLQAYSKECEMNLFVMDNGSSDNTLEWATEQDGVTSASVGEHMVGYITAIHQAIEKFHLSNNLLIMQAPFMPTPGSIRMMLDEINEEEYCVVGPVSNGFLEIQKADLQNFEQACTYQKEIKNELVPTVGLESNVVMVHQTVVQYELMNVSEKFAAPEEAMQDLIASLIMEYKKVGYVTGAVMFSVCGRVYSKQYYETISKQQQMELLEQRWGMKYFNRRPNDNIVYLLNLDNQEPMKVLEIGCDCGATLLEIKNKNPNAKVFGLEINERAVKIASHNANVSQGNIETNQIPFEEKFDYIIFGDVLEHLRDPKGAVSYCKEYLSASGKIIASIPNLMHFSVIRELLQGNFTYTSTGLLDSTHIHFFTYNEIVRMFQEAGFRIEALFQIGTEKTKEDEQYIQRISEFSNTQAFQFETFQYITIASVL